MTNLLSARAKRRKDREQKQKLLKKRELSKKNQTNQAVKQEIKQETIEGLTAPQKEVMARDNHKRDLFEKLTNWQRNKAMKSVNGNYDKLTIDRIEYYGALKHYKENVE